MKITILPARYGDSILFEPSDNDKKFLVDCGFKQTYRRELKPLTSEVDFIILTHVDEDHINGIFPLLEDYPEKFGLAKVYINTPESYTASDQDSDEISIRQGITVEQLLVEKSIPYQSLLQGDRINIQNDIWLEIISPTSEDVDYFNSIYGTVQAALESETEISINEQIEDMEDLSHRKDSFKKKKEDFVNTASIAFILKFKNKNLLFLGDSHPETITEYLKKQGNSPKNKYVFDYVKLSHHGSITSISNEFISLIKCNKFIISTNGGKSKSRHPSRELIAKLALNIERTEGDTLTFLFNYPIEDITNRNGELATQEEMALYRIVFQNCLEIHLQ